MKIAIVDDHQMFAQGLSSFLKETDSSIVFDLYSDPISFVEQCEKAQYEIVLLDISMPELDGFEVVKKLTGNERVIVITMHAEPAYISPMSKIDQVYGYLLKTDDQKEIYKAIKNVSKGERYYSRSAQKVLKQIDQYNSEESVWLTTRELDILRLLDLGLNASEIADKLSIEKSTVETHKKNMIRKAGVNNTIKLLHLARQNNWI